MNLRAVRAMKDEFLKIQEDAAPTPQEELVFQKAAALADYYQTRNRAMAKMAGVVPPAAGGFGRKLLSMGASHPIETAGLGILAAPSIQTLRGKEQSEKTKAKYELAGLGTLAAPSVYHMGKHLLSRH